MVPFWYFAAPIRTCKRPMLCWRWRLPSVLCQCALGNVVANYARPAETVASLRTADCVIVADYCEVQSAAGAKDCGIGFEDGSTCDLLPVKWFGFASVRIGASEHAWMAGLPDVISLSYVGSRHSGIYDGVFDMARFVWLNHVGRGVQGRVGRIEGCDWPVRPCDRGA